MNSIKENLYRVWERIEKAAQKSGRKREDITLVAVTKTVEVERIREGIEAGIKEIGENRVQEAREKIPLLPREGIKWHMVGHLQRNKAKYAVRLFDMIQSLDSLSLAEELEKRCQKENRTLEVLIEVNIGGEETKFGVAPQEVISLIEKVKDFPHLKIKGLMCVPPWLEDPEKVRPYFIQMRELKEKVIEEKIPGVEMKYLSMGMTDDFEIAIEEGANMVRLGRAIFGERKK